jgi:hypothetical protein
MVQVGDALVVASKPLLKQSRDIGNHLYGFGVNQDLDCVDVDCHRHEDSWNRPSLHCFGRGPTRVGVACGRDPSLGTRH